jgi:hypothetical protein
VVPGTSAERRPARPARTRPTAERGPATAERGPARPARTRPTAERGPARPAPTRPTPERGQARPGRTRLTIAVAAACVLAALLAWWFLIKPSPSGPEPTVERFCSDLIDGQVRGAYQQFSDSYRRVTTFPTFKTSLLGSKAIARCTPTMTAADQATVSLLRTDGTAWNATLGLQQEAGQWQIASMQVRP